LSSRVAIGHKVGQRCSKIKSANRKPSRRRTSTKYIFYRRWYFNEKSLFLNLLSFKQIVYLKLLLKMCCMNSRTVTLKKKCFMFAALIQGNYDHNKQIHICASPSYTLTTCKVNCCSKLILVFLVNSLSPKKTNVE